jgi:levanbiose-producing levanase
MDAPGYHLTAPHGWMNDPQRPLLLGGTWHLWYLFNADHPKGNGTEWRLARSADLVRWVDGGVAIRKYTDGLGDIESGSAVVDTAGRAGLGAGTVLATATQQADGIQRQSLFASRDAGRTFAPVPGNPVIDNPGTPASADFRDPKIIRDDEHDQWVMVLAEGHRLGFYTSADLRAWTYRSDLVIDGLGVLECPDLFELDVDGDPARRTWVLLASANGAGRGRTTGVAYWTGQWDGTRFTPDGTPERWLDHGPDLYAAVTWPDERVPPPDRFRSRLAIGWLNNWAYARDRGAGSHAGGAQSVVREIALVRGDGGPVLTSRPVGALDALTGAAAALGLTTTEAAGQQSVELPTPCDSARLELDVESEARWTLRLGDGGGGSVSLDVTPARDVSVARSSPPGRPLGPTWSAPQRGPMPPGSNRTALTILLDRGSVEVFSADGRLTLSAATDLDEVTTVRLETSARTTVHAATAAPIRPVQLA